VCAGAGTPQPVVDLLNASARSIRPCFARLMATSGSVAVASTSQGFHRVIEDTASAAAPIISELGWIEHARCD
jgi:tripartite-type tricarboxylate transporter receptor subunit TctC